MPAVRWRAVEAHAVAVEIARDGDGGYAADAPALPGCITQGGTRERAQANMEEAMSLYPECVLESGGEIPPGVSAAEPAAPSAAVAAARVRGKSVSVRIG